MVYIRGMDTTTKNGCAAIIPARMASTRLPGKVLADIGGKAMLHHVVDAARSASLFDQVIVATDSEEVLAYCDKHTIDCRMTLSSHATGTERVAEVALTLDADNIVNLQADEPFISPAALQSIYECIHQPHVQIASLCCEVDNTTALFDYNVVKVTRSATGRALYFSRQAIPAQRDKPYRDWVNYRTYLQHVGIYAYKKECLQQLISLPASDLADTESLEQLRWLEHDYEVYLAQVADATLGVDTAKDLAAARRLYKYVLSKK